MNNVEKKKILVRIYGGKCEKCGYGRNYASLVFHEDEGLNNKKKDSKGHTVSFVNTDLAKKIIESGVPDKRVHLMCSNCHGEFHHPELEI